MKTPRIPIPIVLSLWGLSCGAPGAPDAQVGQEATIAPPRQHRSSQILATPAGKSWALRELNGKEVRGGRDQATLDASAFSRGTFRPPTRAPAPVLTPALPLLSPSQLSAEMTPGMMAILTGQAATGFSAIPKALEPEGSPKIFQTQAWNPPTVLAGSGGTTRGGTPSRASGGLTTGGGTSAGPTSAGGYASPSFHAVRYACCEGVQVRANPSGDAGLVETLGKSQEVWVTDLLPGTAMQSIIDSIDDCLSSGSPSCWNAVTAMAQISNVSYYAELYIPATGETGYAPIQSLFVRPNQEIQGQATLEIGFDKVADAMKSAIDTKLNTHCGTPAHSITVHAPQSGDLYYDGSREFQLSCDDALACPDWRVASCADIAEDDEAFAGCVYSSADQCGGPIPDVAPSTNLKYCVKNSCPGKSTCGVCRAWFEETGQDVTGWQTEEALVHACEQDLQAQSQDGDLPLVCLGGTKPNCVEYCQQHVATWNVAGCQRYIAAGDSRSYADPTDYECGELPFGETHPALWFYSAIGAWSGTPDEDLKVLTEFPLFGQDLQVTADRLAGQKPIQFDTYDLGIKANKSINRPQQLGSQNVWLSTTPAAVDLSTFDDDLPAGTTQALRIGLCIHLPGLDVYGPTAHFDPGETPMSMISAIDFGTAEIARTDLCLDGYAWLNAELAPRMLWTDVSLDLDFSYSGLEITKGVGFYSVAAVASLIPVVGEIIGGIVLGAMAIEEIAEAIINSDSDWFEEMLLSVFEAKIHGVILDSLNDMTTSALGNVDPKADEELEALCDKLSPSVPDTHPYYYFYKFVNEQCELAKDTYKLKPFQANAGSQQQGCYGTSKLYTPADAGGNRWWQKYSGQEWYFPLFPDQGCRLGNQVKATLDQAMWPVLRCGVASFNWWFHNGLAGFSPPPGAVSHLGALGYVVSEVCSDVGYSALKDLYGDGADLVELYRSKHGDGGLGLSGG